MKAIVVTAVIILSCPAAWASGADSASDSDQIEIAELFPSMEGWERVGAPSVYAADNLWEYIDGAAELYLTYDFEEMGTLAYADGGGRELTIDIYRHASDADAFGIYSQERPTPMDAVPIGAQGYYSRGVLNFCHGRYYVKLSGYDLEESDRGVLDTAAIAVSAKIGGETELPAALMCFPEKGREDGTERYIARNLFGHRFLHSAFVARYRVDGDTTALALIIEAEDAAAANRVLEEYLLLVAENRRSISQQDGVYRFEDPISRSAGTVNLKHSGRYIWGLSSTSASTAGAFIAVVEKNLRASGLID